MSDKLLIHQNISEKKSSKMTGDYFLDLLSKDERPTPTVRMTIVTTWTRNDRPEPEVEPHEVYEIPSYQLAQLIAQHGKRLPK